MGYKFACEWYCHKTSQEYWGKHLAGVAYQLRGLHDNVDEEFDLWEYLSDMEEMENLPDGFYNVYMQGTLDADCTHHWEFGDEFEGWDITDVEIHIQNLSEPNKELIP